MDILHTFDVQKIGFQVCFVKSDLIPIIESFNPILAGGGHWMAPPSKIGFYASGNEFWVTPNGWQFLSTYIFEDSFCFWDKNDLENVLEYHIWGKGQFLKILRRNKTFISEAIELSEGWKYGFLRVTNTTRQLPGV